MAAALHAAAKPDGGLRMPVRLSFGLFLALLVAVGLAVANPTSARPRLAEAQPAPVQPLTAEDLKQTRQELDMLHLINLARQDPPGFVPTVQGGRIGSGAGRQEAIDYLTGTAPVGALTYDPALAAAARAHARDIGASGALSHIGSDGSRPGGRIGVAMGGIPTLTAEELSFGQRDAIGSVLQLILDEGVAGRPHRRDLFNPVFTYGGVGCGPHIDQKNVCVIVMSNGTSLSTFVLDLSEAGPPCPDLKAEFPQYAEYAQDIEWFETQRAELHEKMKAAADAYAVAGQYGDRARQDELAPEMTKLDAELDHLHDLWRQWKAETAEFTEKLRARVNELPPDCRRFYRIG
jgi:hypothetical protein